jgi:hypothetical protein
MNPFLLSPTPDFAVPRKAKSQTMVTKEPPKHAKRCVNDHPSWNLYWVRISPTESEQRCRLCD